MTVNFIEKIDNEMEKLIENSKNLESIFSLGIKLGRHLSASGENFDRLPYFVRNDNFKNSGINIAEISNKICALISSLFFQACADQIKNCGAITFAADAKSYRNSHPLKKSIFEKYLIGEFIGGRSSEDGTDFIIEFELIGGLADLFYEYKLERRITIAFESGSYETYIELRSLEDLNRRAHSNSVEDDGIFNTLLLRSKDRAESESMAIEFFNKFKQELLFIHIAHPV